MQDEPLRFIRLKRVIMKNFRNIEYGKVDFPNSGIDESRSEQPSIMGLYGQNGSGKTSLVMALGILKNALSDRSIDGDYDGCVREGCDFAELNYEFTFWCEDGRCLVVNYSFHLTEKPVKKSDKDGTEYMDDVLFISDEVLSYSGTDAEGNRIGKTLIVDTSPNASKKGYPFGRDKEYEKLFGKEKETAKVLSNNLAIRYSESKSAVFNETVYDYLYKDNHKDVDDILLYLHIFGSAYLHVIDNHKTGINNLNVKLPLILWSVDNREGRRGLQIMDALLSMGKHEQSLIPEEYYPVFCDTVEAFNQVLCKLVPGLGIEAEDLGKTKTKRGKDAHAIGLYSVRKGIKIPLNYESDGIRRIISIMSLLIAVFNQRSMTVVIDEIDSGIYEYLLGEILRIMSNSAKGQLIFTSHNLRPLEVLPSKFICFTSTNPEKRYVKLIRTGNSNLRDQYFKKIILGSEDEQLYDPTDNYEIELAFYNAGRIQDRTL